LTLPTATFTSLYRICHSAARLAKRYEANELVGARIVPAVDLRGTAERLLARELVARLNSSPGDRDYSDRNPADGVPQHPAFHAGEPFRSPQGVEHYRDVHGGPRAADFYLFRTLGRDHLFTGISRAIPPVWNPETQQHDIPPPLATPEEYAAERAAVISEAVQLANDVAASAAADQALATELGAIDPEFETEANGLIVDISDALGAAQARAEGHIAYRAAALELPVSRAAVSGSPEPGEPFALQLRHVAVPFAVLTGQTLTLLEAGTYHFELKDVFKHAAPSSWLIQVSIVVDDVIEQTFSVSASADTWVRVPWETEIEVGAGAVVRLVNGTVDFAVTAAAVFKVWRLA
jgi:hypothetical protein